MEKQQQTETQVENTADEKLPNSLCERKGSGDDWLERLATRHLKEARLSMRDVIIVAVIHACFRGSQIGTLSHLTEGQLEKVANDAIDMADMYEQVQKARTSTRN